MLIALGLLTQMKTVVLGLKSRWGMRYFKRPTVGRCARTVSSPGDNAYTCRLKLGWDGINYPGTSSPVIVVMLKETVVSCG